MNLIETDKEIQMGMTVSKIENLPTTPLGNPAQFRASKVVLSGFDRKQYVLDMLEAGTSTYLVRGSHSCKLVSTLRSVMMGHKYTCPAIAAASVGKVACFNKDGTPQPGMRECEALLHLVESNASRMHAKRLFISTDLVNAPHLGDRNNLACVALPNLPKMPFLMN